MDYEIIKQLKKHGYPFNISDPKTIPCNSETGVHSVTLFRDWSDPIFVESGVVYFVPTLSELIEACPKEHFMLQFYNGNWFATDGLIGKSGSTPEEAVAHLWLALHVNGNATA